LFVDDGYPEARPVAQPIEEPGGADGPKRLCVQARSPSGVDQVDATRIEWVQDTLAPATPVLTGAPLPQDTELDVTVSGAGLVEYGFALLDGSPGCGGVTYSDWIPVATAITGAIGEDGPKTLCVRAVDVARNLAPLVSYRWEKDRQAPVASLANVPSSSSVPEAEEDTAETVAFPRWARAVVEPTGASWSPCPTDRRGATGPVLSPPVVAVTAVEPSRSW
jgi:hypothetical protein